MTSGNPEFKVDLSKFLEATGKAKLNARSLQIIAKPAIAVIQNRQRMLVPVDTGATRASIRQHDIYVGDTEFITDIGPETIYSYWIEYGIPSRPRYPIQPFVRPSVFGQEEIIKTTVARALASYLRTVVA